MYFFRPCILIFPTCCTVTPPIVCVIRLLDVKTHTFNLLINYLELKNSRDGVNSVTQILLCPLCIIVSVGIIIIISNIGVISSHPS